MKLSYSGLLVFGCLVAGCGGGSSGGGGGAVSTPTPVMQPTALPTGTPGPTPTPVSPPPIVFDLRGKVTHNGQPVVNARVTAMGDPGAATAQDETLTTSGGGFSFFLGAGTYTLQATSGALQGSVRVTIPPGGQVVDNVQIAL